jgi:hypothetical protein
MDDIDAKWRAALAEPDRRKWPSVDMNHPEAGYYRVKRNGHWQPRRYLYEDGELYCCAGERVQPGKPLHEVWLSLEDAIESFSWAWSNPISKEAYEAVMVGGPWPDIDPVVAEQMAGIGHNQASDDPLKQFEIDIENAAGAVETYKEVNEDTNAAARSAQARLQELARAADNKRSELKAPSLATCQKIDKDWGGLVKKAREAAVALGRAMGVWESKKARALEAARRVEEETRRAEERAAQAEADRAIAAGIPPSVMEAPKPAPAPAPTTPAPATRIKGGYGRAGHVYVEKVIKEVTDYGALATAYINHNEVQALIKRLAAVDVKNGHTPPGVVIEEERKVR